MYTTQICLLVLGIVYLDRYNIHLGCFFVLFYLGWGGAIQQYAHIFYYWLSFCVYDDNVFIFMYYSNLKYVCIFFLYDVVPCSIYLYSPIPNVSIFCTHTINFFCTKFLLQPAIICTLFHYSPRYAFGYFTFFNWSSKFCTIRASLHPKNSKFFIEANFVYVPFL